MGACEARPFAQPRVIRGPAAPFLRAQGGSGNLADPSSSTAPFSLTWKVPNKLQWDPS